MKYVKVPFDHRIMYQNGGIEADLFCQMLKKFPSDSKVIGFGRDDSTMIDYMFISSDQFDEVDLLSFPPSASVSFRKNPDGTVICESVYFGKSSKICIHDWFLYIGLSETYNYCKNCGVKQ